MSGEIGKSRNKIKIPIIGNLDIPSAILIGFGIYAISIQQIGLGIILMVIGIIKQLSNT